MKTLPKTDSRLRATCLLAASLLVACGGGGGGNNGVSDTNKPIAVTVATGLAVGGAILSAKCDAGTVAASGVTDSLGVTKLDFSKASFPCLVQASFVQNGQPQRMYTLLTRAQAFNITPLTQGISAQAWQTFDMDGAFDAASSIQIKAAAQNLSIALARVRAVAAADGLTLPSDPVFDTLVPKSGDQQGDAHDKLLDALKLKYPSATGLLDWIKKIRGDTPTPTSTFPIGGTLTGLSSGKSLILQNNAGDDLSLTSNGTFQFATSLLGGKTYLVSVKTQPSGQTCSITMGSGTADAVVSDANVTCATQAYTVSGSVTGLGAGKTLVLQNNASNDLSVSGNGPFSFSTPVAEGASYAVSILTQPAGQFCTVNNPTGVATSNVSTAIVSCSNQAYTIGGVVSGLGVGKTLTLQNNAGNDLPLNANGAFGFTTPVVSGGNYLVTIKTQPAQQACSVSDGSGTVSASSVASISVVCTNSAISTNYLKTSGAQLLDAAGNAVVLRGVNVPVFKSGYADDLVQVVAAVKASGSNAARIVWWSTPPQGTTQYTIANLEEAIRTVAHSGMLPIVELHDATCYLALPQASCNDATIFNNRITNFWIRQDVMAILQKYQGYLIVNLANEWGRLPSEDGDASAFTNHYATVIQTVRNAWNGAGLSNIPLMVDAPNGGSYSGAFLGQHISGATNGQHLINSDPGHNVLLSTHAYWPTSEGHTDNSISQRLEALANSGLPFVLGEVGSNANGSCGATDEVPWRTIMNKAVQYKLGTMAWAWYEESCPSMNLTVNQDGKTLPPKDNTDDFQHRMLYDTNFGLSSALPIGNNGQIIQYAITATVDWAQCDGGIALAQGMDWVSNSNCKYGAVTYFGLNEAKAFIDRIRITPWFNNGWVYIGSNIPVTDSYVLRTANCHTAMSTLRSVGGGLTGNQLYVRAKAQNQSSVVELTGGKYKDLTLTFPYSQGAGIWSCN